MSQEVKAPEKSSPEVGTMQKGDYMIHVYVQEGKEFKGEKADTVTPMIQICCGGKNKYTTSKNDVGPASNVYWGEHIFFERNNVSKNEIESSQIQLRVLNKGFLKDELLGSYDFDVTYVYFQQNHTLYNQWIALSNPEGKDFNEITCYLKIAISIAGPGDEQIQLNDSTGVKSEDQEVMMPPQIRKEYKQLIMRFIKGEKFPKMDTLGTIDAYIYTTYFKKKLKTKAITQTKNHECFIEQEFYLPIQWPLATDRLVLNVYDEDNVKDEIVGSMNFSLRQLIQSSSKPEGRLTWLNLYGSPLGCSGENTDKMNEFPELASTWKGRILMHISAADTKNPEMKVQALTPELKNKFVDMGAFVQQEYEILVEFCTGISLPGTKKYKMRLQINDFIYDSKQAIEAKGNYNRWSDRSPVTSFKGPYKSIEELGKVFFYLLDGDDPICFWAGQASEFTNTNAPHKWIPMQADLSKGKVKNSWEAGLISIKLSINHKTKNGSVNFAQQEAWKKPPPKRLSSWKIRCYLFQCKDIPSADSDGASDPYITLWNPDNKVVKTQTIEDNINPIFFEALEIYYDFDKLETAAPIVLNIWDADDLLDADDYLGRCVVYLKDASITEGDSIPEPKWHDIRIGFSDSEPACGQMLVSFAVVNDDFTFKTPISYLKLTDEIEYKDFNCEINILGLRQLQSFGLMPVKKPFVKFNLRSLLPPEKAQAVTNIKTQPNSTGPNPNINTMISFQIDLPVNPLFCPKLQCDVYDYVYKGLVQPLLGTFTLSIGDIMHQLNKERQLDIEESENIIVYLKEFLEKMSKAQPLAIKNQQDPNMSFIDKNVEGFNKLGEDRQLTDTGVSEEKQKLLTGQSQQQPPTFRDSVISNAPKGPDEEEKKSLLDQTEAEEPKLDKSRSRSKSPMDITPERLRKRAQTTSIFKKGNDNQLIKDMELGVGFKVMIEKQKNKSEEQKKLLQDRHNDFAELKKAGEAHKNVIMSRYVYEDRIKKKVEASPKPPATIYMEIGFDKEPPENPELAQKHYRRYYADELENIKAIFPRQTFNQADIIRGQSRGLSEGWFSFLVKSKTDDSGQVTNQKKVGYFKGRITVENAQEKILYKKQKESRMQLVLKELDEIHRRLYGQELNFQTQDLESFEKASAFEHKLEEMGLDNPGILSFLKEQSYEEMIARLLLQKTRCIVRLYVLEGFDFAQRDIGSFSDPYLVIKCGPKKFNERDIYQLDEPNPKFFKMYEFDAEFPGSAPLVIKAYDYDDLFGDDLIGKTVIDLDDRFFCPEWQQIEEKPIEYRQLHHPSSECSQGVIKLWCEILPTNSSRKGNPRTWDVTPEPILEYELRLVIYDTKETKVMDVEDCSDVFIKAYVEDKDRKETDCHYRCQDRKASFNYRLLFNVKAPRTKYDLTIQTWDRDLFKSNDFIGEIQFPLQHIFQDAMVTQQPMNLTKKYYNTYLKEQLTKIGKGDLIKEFQDDDTFFLDTFDSEGKSAGLVRIGLGIYPSEMAKSNPVGGGRSEPNHSPFLPPPVGRISFTLNPITLFFQMVGPEMRWKVYKYLCCALCCVLFVALLPMITSNLISAGIMSIFSSK